VDLAANRTTAHRPRSRSTSARAANTLDERLQGRVVVVSPHLDDAVLSLGAALAHAVEAGAQVEVLTVFGCEPASSAPTHSWDRKSGFATEGEAAQKRRAEDRAACSILGVIPRWFDFGAEPYERRASTQEILTAIKTAVAGADTVLIPGYPLAHYDHATLGHGLLSETLNCRCLGLYVEQPYAFDRRLAPRGRAETAATASFTWQPLPAHGRHRRKKLEAVKQYRSQIGSLGLRQPAIGHLRLRMMLWYEARHGGETVAWPKAT
jgi:LmbE family N-acetylglucosaminyl deacetylase